MKTKTPPAEPCAVPTKEEAGKSTGGIYSLHGKYKAADSDRIDALDAMRSVAPQLLRDLCDSSGAPMSLRQLSRRIGRSPSYVSQVMNGHCQISAEAFRAIADLHATEAN